MPSLSECGENEETEWEEVAGDYVFRIVNNTIADKEGENYNGEGKNSIPERIT